MGFDAMHEDYQRMGLRYARAIGAEDPVACLGQTSSFKRRFARNHDSLPQTDEDRAFHLMARASVLIDRQLPFAGEDTGQNIIDEARQLIDEATAIDPLCFDAVRIKAAQDCGTLDSYYKFLSTHASHVRSECEARAEAIRATASDDAVELETDLAMRPYVRWMATLATKALECGRYTRAVEIARELRTLDPANHAGSVQTAFLAYAKLEDIFGLHEFATECEDVLEARITLDPWYLLAELAVAYRLGMRDDARRALHALLGSTPHAASILVMQQQLPEGVFSRLDVEQGSDSELALAVSEASLLLQEGRVAAQRGSLGEFIASDADVALACAEEERSSRSFTFEDADLRAHGSL
jgi:hypothetical protein